MAFEGNRLLYVEWPRWVRVSHGLAPVALTQMPYKDIDHIICGTCIQECKTSNDAREVALRAGIPDKV
ncbi:hypothetical protein ANCDUO_25171 [Ancylostoma duodenale]|uniref:Uncharacterized protein n=1 Tax=Ancylostoma duodenale TaxID=51022 RepID=A0A0C2F8K2_9BILA|nr:hypothetical protein ANCDUO_25171 [Ancylostoma duodenale]